jgi:N-acetyltransferase
MLEGGTIRLISLLPQHASELWEAIGPDEAIWKWIYVGELVPDSPEALEAVIKRRIAKPDVHFFAIQEIATGSLVGSTAFLDIRSADRHVEIGSTYLAPKCWGSLINIEAKLLMLSDAFDRRNCVRVTLKANADNHRSRKAIEKIGATLEGILRKQREERDGSWRDAAYYSIISEEWPTIRERLTTMLTSRY